MKTFRVLAWLMLFAVLYTTVSNALMHKSPDVFAAKKYTAHTESQFQVVALGSSHMYCAFDTIELYKDFGLSSFVLATRRQPLEVSYHLIDKVHTANVILLEAYMLVIDDLYEDSVWHSAYDGWELGWWKCMAICAARYEKMEELLFPLIKYHTRWKDFKIADFPFEKNDYFGYRFYMKRNSLKTLDWMRIDSGSNGMHLPNDNEAWFKEICANVKKGNAKLVVIVVPYQIGLNAAYQELISRRFKRVKELAKDMDVPVVDLFEQKGLIDEQTDFYDKGHLNVFGAEKATRYIGQWLVDHYDFNTNMTAECRAKWDAEVKRYDKAYDKAKAAVISVNTKAKGH